MFDKDSYVVRPPLIIEREQRICLEAIAFSMQATMRSLKEIELLTSKPTAGEDIMPIEERVRLFSNLWAVIDQVHMLRSLLQYVASKDGGPGPFLSSFLKRYETATLLRNVMDHPKARLANFANKKKTSPPYYGSLSFFKYRGQKQAASGSLVHWGEAYVVPFGTLSHDAHEFPAVNPAGREIYGEPGRSSLFQFSAFDYTLDISSLFKDIPELATKLEKSVREAVIEAAAPHNLSVEEIEKRPTTLTLKYAIDFNK